MLDEHRPGPFPDLPAQPRRSSSDDASGCWRRGRVLALTQAQRRVPNRHGLGHPSRRRLAPHGLLPRPGPPPRGPMLRPKSGTGPAERVWGLLWARASPPTRSDSPSSRGVTRREARPSRCALGSGAGRKPPASPRALRSAAVRVERTGAPSARAFLLSRTGVRRCPRRELLRLPVATVASTPHAVIVLATSRGLVQSLSLLPKLRPWFVLRSSLFVSCVFLHLAQAGPVPGCPVSGRAPCRRQARVCSGGRGAGGGPR